MTAQNHIETFTSPVGSSLRAVLINGVPWFIAADVCRAVGLDTAWNATRALRDDERSVLEKRTCPDHALFPGKTARVLLISESGLYKLILRSDKPEAKVFQDWVTRVVLPAIRKDGAYIMGEEKLDQPGLSLEDRDSLNDQIIVSIGPETGPRIGVE